MREKSIVGTLFVLGNFLGVVPILGQEGVYRPDQYDAWLSSIQQNPSAHVYSSLLFWIGAVSGIRLGVYLYEQGARQAGFLLIIGAAANALWLPAPIVIAKLGTQLGAFGLSMSLFADSVFNGCLGVTMLVIGFDLLREGRRWIGYSGIGIGLVTSVVALQFWQVFAADVLGIIGPLWLLWWLVYSWSDRTEHT